MAINIKDTGALAEKFAKRAQAAGADFKSGVLAPRRSQSQEAIAAADRWLGGVTAAGTTAFTRGLQKAGDEKWQRKSSTVGADRYPAGAAAAKSDWAAGVAPILDALRSLSLPPRGLRRSPQNISRVQAVIDATIKASGK
jgi:hypothetical protein